MINVEDSINLATQNLPKILQCDVVIVGSGAGGGISAEILSRSGLKVIIVEEGPLRTAADFKMKEKEAYADLYQEVAGRQTLDKGIQILQGRNVGGSTTVNWTSSFRTPTQTLEYWQQEFAVKELSSEQLAPWFDWVEKRLNISPWAIPPNQNNQILADGASTLGWSYGVIPRNVKGCANLGYCGMGCPIDAKQSMLVTTLPAAIKNGAQLIHRARVESVIHKNGRAVGVRLTSMNQLGQVNQRNIAQIMAKQVVISAGAIGSPAVLLRSEIVNPFATLGKRTFLHPVTATIAKMKAKVEAFSGAPQSIYSDHFLWRDGISGELGYKIEVPPMHPVLSSTLLTHHGKLQAELLKNLSNYQANIGLVRDGFHEESQGGQVSLDEYGYPQIDYKITPVVWRSLRAAMLSMSELQFAAGAERVLPLHMDATLSNRWSACKQQIENLRADKIRWQTMSAHVMGGCTMGANEENSVVNSLGQHHQIENLSVIDGSIFPTSLGVNPQLTIYAIAAKLSVQLVKRMKAHLPEDLSIL